MPWVTCCRRDPPEYTYNELNELTTAGDEEFTDDLNGNMVGRGSTNASSAVSMVADGLTHVPQRQQPQPVEDMVRRWEVLGRV